MPQTVSTPVSGHEGTPWGTLAAIDLHGCAFGPLADPDRIRAFVPALIEAIAMRAHGPLAPERTTRRSVAAGAFRVSCTAVASAS